MRASWTRNGVVGVVIIATLLLSGACADDVPSATQSDQRVSAVAEAALSAAGFPCRTLVVTAPEGAVTERCVWVADTGALRDRGLKGVTDPGLGGRDAMAFVFGTPTTATFWMKDTVLPLTVVWIGADGRILGATDMEPCDPSGSRCPTFPPPGPYTMAIEVARGRAADLGLVTGASVALGDPCAA